MKGRVHVDKGEGNGEGGRMRREIGRTQHKVNSM